MRRLIAAIGFLTRLPVPRLALDEADFAGAVRYYPIAGLLVGVCVASAAWAGSLRDPWLGAFLGLVAWVAATGALHLDGLGDVADGVGAAHGDRHRMLTAMADPHVGSFGAVAIVLQLIAKLVLLKLQSGDWLVLAIIPAAARIGPLAWAAALPPLKFDGLGASIAESVRVRDLAGWLALAAGAVMLSVGLLALVPLLLLFLLWVRRRLGGVSGDVHGAGIELIETGLLFACTIVRGGLALI